MCLRITTKSRMTEIGYTAPTGNVSPLLLLCPAVLPQNTDVVLPTLLSLNNSFFKKQLTFILFLYLFILSLFIFIIYLLYIYIFYYSILHFKKLLCSNPLNINQPKQAKEKRDVFVISCSGCDSY